MDQSLTYTFENLNYKKYITLVLPLFAVVLSIVLMKEYFMPGIQIALGIMVAPFVFVVSKNNYSYRYAFLSLLFLVGYYFLQIYVLLFLSAGCFILVSIECQFGKIGILPFIFLVCISPAAHYIINVFTFSIRLVLSKFSATILNTVGVDVINKGSYFVLPDGSSFTVDSACIGLNMINTGLAVALLLIGMTEQKTNTTFKIKWVLLVFITTLLCLVATNLFRIVALVLFKSAPEMVSHDLIGIASLLLYTVLPIYFLINYLSKYNNAITISYTQIVIAPIKKNIMLLIFISVALCLTKMNVTRSLSTSIKDNKLMKLNLPHFTKAIKEDGVVEFKNKNTLIYIKPANKGFESDHPPSMCWQGAGFKLEKITETTIHHFTIFTALLKKDKVIQYTAWWYDNGINKTISQWEWRFSKNEPYRIINITTNNATDLEVLCKEYLDKKLF